MNVVQVESAVAVVERLVEALAAQDFEAVAGCVSRECRVRAYTPNHVFGGFGPEIVAETFRNWVGSATDLAVVDSAIEPVLERVRLRYCIEVSEDGQRKRFEQMGYVQVENGEITDLAMVCSGKLVVSEIRT